MKTSAFIPVGPVGNVTTKRVNKGDVVKLVTGELVTFTEMKRVRFIGKLDGKGISIPLYRDRMQTKPYVVEVTGQKDKEVLANRVKPTGLKYGNLFALEGHKETFMYVGSTLKRGEKKLVGIDLATGRRFTIGTGFVLVKVNIPKIKRENPLEV